MFESNTEWEVNSGSSCPSDKGLVSLQFNLSLKYAIKNVWTKFTSGTSKIFSKLMSDYCTCAEKECRMIRERMQNHFREIRYKFCLQN